jgi:Fe-Mn family superoxide dismutase
MLGFTEPMLQLHFKLYEGYVKNTNDLLQQLQELSDSGKEGSVAYGALKRRLGWEFDGMRLHELYFGNLGGNGTPDAKSPLYVKIVAQFGSFDRWKKDFIATGLMRGIGWAVLYLDPSQKRLVNSWINEHDVGHLAGGNPILIMDLFEHAYITEYGLDRAKYIDAFFKNIDWCVVQSRY